jgi:hypothetical protein
MPPKRHRQLLGSPPNDARSHRRRAEQAERVAAGQVLPDSIRELLASDRVREIE